MLPSTSPDVARSGMGFSTPYAATFYGTCAAIVTDVRCCAMTGHECRILCHFTIHSEAEIIQSMTRAN